LSEGWDVQSVSHILGLRAFGSPLLTEQIIGRGLRRTNYDVLNQPIEERPDGSEETVDAFGIPFVGFPVEKRKRPKTGEWGQKPVWIEPDAKKEKFRVFPGTEALMGELRRRRIATAVATSSKKEQLEAVVASSGLDVEALVDKVVTGSDAAESKPAPDLVHAALAKLGSDPRRSVMVGDTPYDGQACARAGVSFLGLLCGGRPPELLMEAGALALYADPADLLLHLDEALRLPVAATS